MSSTAESPATPAPPSSRAGSLLRSSGAMAAGTVASRLLGFVRAAVLAAVIGTRTLGDVFGQANAVPNILFTLVAGGVLNAVFVPQLVRAMKNNEDGGEAYADRLLTLSFVVLGVVTVIATLAAPLVIDLYSASNWTDRDTQVATLFAFWCLPQIFFYGVYTMLGQVLNARGSFGPMMWTPILNNLVAIATVLLFWAVASIDPEHTASLSGGEIALLGGGTTLGIAVQALALAPVLRRTGYRYHPRFDWRGVGLGRAGSLAKWTIGFVAVNQLAYIVVVKLTAAAGKLSLSGGGTGTGYNAYQNAYLILLLPHSIATVSIVTALLPRMSEAAAVNRIDDVRRDLSHGLRLVGVLSVPAAAAFLAFGPEIGAVIFGWGSNSVADGLALGQVLSGFALGLVPFGAHYLLLRAYYAQEDTRTPFWFACLIAVTNALLAWVAYEIAPVQWKTVAIAVAYTLSYVLGVSVSASVLRWRLDGIDGFRIVQTHVRLGLAAVIGAVPGWLAARGIRAALPETWGTMVLALAVGGALTAGLYVVAARRMRVAEVTTLLATVTARLGR